jgi:hypothetical protein
LGLFYFNHPKGDTTMNHQEIIRHLCQLQPPQVVHEITTENIISEIVRRMGEEALALSVEDLELAMEEVKAAFEHYPQERELIAIGLDSWAIIRNL